MTTKTKYQTRSPNKRPDIYRTSPMHSHKQAQTQISVTPRYSQSASIRVRNFLDKELKKPRTSEIVDVLSMHTIELLAAHEKRRKLIQVAVEIDYQNYKAKQAENNS